MLRAVEQRPHVRLVPPGDVDHQHTCKARGQRHTHSQLEGHHERSSKPPGSTGGGGGSGKVTSGEPGLPVSPRKGRRRGRCRH